MSALTFPKSKPPRPATARRFCDSFAAAKGTTGNVYLQHGSPDFKAAL